MFNLEYFSRFFLIFPMDKECKICSKYIKIELKTLLSVSIKKDNSRCMTSSATLT